MPPKKKEGPEWTITFHNRSDEFCEAPVLKGSDELGLPVAYFFPEEFDFSVEVKFFIAQLEKAATVHMQGYVEFLEDCSLLEAKAKLRHILGKYYEKVHLEYALGDRTSNIAYCTKSESRWLESSNPSIRYERAGTIDTTIGKGRRIDKVGLELQVYKMLENDNIKDVADAIDAAKTLMMEAHRDRDEYQAERARLILCNLRTNARQHAETIEKRKRATKRKREMECVERRVVQVRVLIGPPGTGKTRLANLQYQTMGLYPMQSYSKYWFYKGEKAILLDDWKGEVQGGGAGPPYVTPSLLQQLCEGWKMYGEVKHQAEPVEIVHHVLVITTNLVFEDWYNSWKGVPEVTKQSIRSRIPQSCWEIVAGPDRRPVNHKKYEVKELPVKELDTFNS